MNESNPEIQAASILGQKYAYATVSLVLALSCFTSLLGLEKAILAVVFGCLALKSTPAPVLKARRVWAKVGIGLAAAVLILVPTVILLNLDRLQQFIEVLTKLSEGK